MRIENPGGVAARAQAKASPNNAVSVLIVQDSEFWACLEPLDRAVEKPSNQSTSISSTAYQPSGRWTFLSRSFVGGVCDLLTLSRQ